MNAHHKSPLRDVVFDRPHEGAHPAPVRQTAGSGALRTLTSDILFRGAKEIGIEHGGAFYRLKITRQGKLILNK